MGAVFGKPLVVVFRSHNIRVALHFEVRFGELVHERHDVVESRVAVLGKLRRIEFEVDSLLEQFKVMLLLERATDRIYGNTRDGIRALVLVIEHTVLIGISRATDRVDRDTQRSIRALVLIIGHLVLVAIERATHSIDLHALRGVGALVLVIEHAVFIGINRAAFHIHLNTLRSVGALVQTVENLVSVGIDTATVSIHHDGLGRMRALVLVVLHTVAVVVAHGRLAEGPGELRDAGNKRVRHVAVVERLAVLALVFEHEVFAAIHFVVYVVTYVEQVPYANVDTHGKLNVAKEVEERHLQAKAGRKQHRVYQRVDRVVVVAKSHFATEFQERSEPFVHHVVDSGAVHERVGTVAEHRHEPKAGIPYKREVTLGEIHFGDTR